MEATTQLSQGSREELNKLKQQISSLQDKNKELEQICEKVCFSILHLSQFHGLPIRLY